MLPSTDPAARRFWGAGANDRVSIPSDWIFRLAKIVPADSVAPPPPPPLLPPAPPRALPCPCGAESDNLGRLTILIAPPAPPTARKAPDGDTATLYSPPSTAKRWSASVSD